MRTSVSDIDLRNLRYITLNASKMDATFEITARQLTKYDQAIHDVQWTKFCESLWEHARSLVVALTGISQNFIHPARWKISPGGDMITRVFNSPEWQTRPYQSFDVMIHLRDSFMGDRSIDHNFIDMFLNFSSDPYALEHAPIDNDEIILDLLHNLMPQISDFLTGISRIVLAEDNVHVKTLYPVWEEQCEIETGADAYWIKGVIT